MCTEPIEVVSYKIGVCRVSPKGKDCQTEFERLSYNGKTSVVLCKPRTGRMHQIRVHLQYLGEYQEKFTSHLQGVSKGGRVSDGWMNRLTFTQQKRARSLLIGYEVSSVVITRAIGSLDV